MNGYEKHSRAYSGPKVTGWSIALAVAGIACLVTIALLG
jgi:hypothetical protein